LQSTEPSLRLVVGHEIHDPEYPLSHGFDPSDYVHPRDIARFLDDSVLKAVRDPFSHR
jgi:hypothetical protein